MTSRIKPDKSFSVLFHFLALRSYRAMIFGQPVGELLVRRLCEDSFLPQIGGQIGVCLRNGSIGGLGEIAQSSSGATSGSVAILNTSHLQEFLGDWSRDDASSSGGRNKPHPNGPTFSSDLTGHSMRSTDFVTPKATTYRHDGQLSQNNGSTDCSSDLFGAFDSQSNVSVIVSNSNECLKVNKFL